MPKKQLTEEEGLQRAINFSEKYVARGPYEFFPDAEVVRVVQEGLGKNELEFGYRYCP